MSKDTSEDPPFKLDDELIQASDQRYKPCTREYVTALQAQCSQQVQKEYLLRNRFDHEKVFTSIVYVKLLIIPFQFHKAFERFTNKILSQVSWDNMVVAGGTVVGKCHCSFSLTLTILFLLLHFSGLFFHISIKVLC